MKLAPAIHTIAVLVLVTFLHLFKIPDLPDQFDHIRYADKIIHAIMFAAVSFFLYRCLVFYGRNSFSTAMVVVITLTLYAFSMEFLQDKMTQYRSFEWEDLLADVVGFFPGIWLSRQRMLVFFFEHKVWKSV